MKPRDALLIGGIGAALILMTRRAQAEPLPDGADLSNLPPDPFGAAQLADEVQQEAQSTGDPVSAFLRAIRIAETGSPDDYSIFYGGTHFTDFSNHPVLTGEKKGVPLPSTFCTRAGLPPGCVSTAAGAYQINVPTWTDLQTRWGWNPLPDFSPDSQDQAALRILDHDGALQLLDAGDVLGAVKVASRRWASLPGSSAGQGGRSLEWFLAQFNEGFNA